MAVDPVEDKGLIALDASHLFEPSTTRIGFRKGTFLRGFMYDFLEAFAPHLTRERVDAAIKAPNREEREMLFESIELPIR
jgi:LysR family cys regulon transcriptional activator